MTSPAGTNRALVRAEDLVAARAAVRRFLAPTPLLEAPGLGDQVFLKLESLQVTGSFKVRGALAALASLEPGEKVITVSAGNHGLGVAWAARAMGIEACVLLPENASRRKVDALRAYPARVITHGTYEEAREVAFELAADEGWHFVSPFNDRHVIAGQSTVGTEIFDALGRAAEIVCPLGGGGLASGLAIAARSHPGSRIVGVEADALPSMRASLEAGEVVQLQSVPTIADGITGNLEPGSITFELIRQEHVEVRSIGDPEMEAAIRYLARELGIVAEGAAAAPLAALHAGRVSAGGQPLVLVISGRNIDRVELARILGDSP